MPSLIGFTSSAFLPAFLTAFMRSIWRDPNSGEGLRTTTGMRIGGQAAGLRLSDLHHCCLWLRRLSAGCSKGQHIVI